MTGHPMQWLAHLQPGCCAKLSPVLPADAVVMLHPSFCTQQPNDQLCPASRGEVMGEPNGDLKSSGTWAGRPDPCNDIPTCSLL